MKVNGKMINVMEEAMNSIQMEIYIQGNFKREKLMEKGGINGLHQEKYMMENGQKEQDTVMEYGRK